MHIYLVRIPHRKGHSIQRNVLTWQVPLSAQATASTASFELALAGGISIRRGGSDRTTFAESLFAASLVYTYWRLVKRSLALLTKQPDKG